MKKQIVKRPSACFERQSSEKRKILVEFLTNKSNNIKWLRFANNKLLKLQRFGMSGCLEAQDFVSDAKVIILELVTVSRAFTDNPCFTITRSGKSMSLSRKQLYNYFFLLINWNMSHKFRDDQKTIPLPHWDEDDNGDINPEDDILLCRKKPDNEFINKSYDPFDESNRLKFEKLINECGDSLGIKDPLIRKIFEERLDGTPNRIIAKKYNIPVSKVVNIRKIIRRHFINLGPFYS